MRKRKGTERCDIAVSRLVCRLLETVLYGTDLGSDAATTMTDRVTRSSPLRLLNDTRDVSSAGDLFSEVPPLLDEPSLFYDPPYESALHDEFAWHLVKYLKRGSGLRYHVEAQASACQAARIDFVVEQGAWRVGFMCGSSDAGVEHDRQRDALCMEGAAVDVLYRLRAEDIECRLHDALLLVGRWDTALFSDRGRINLNTLAAPEARAIHPLPTDTVITVSYDEAAPVTDALRVQRLSQSHPEG